MTRSELATAISARFPDLAIADVEVAVKTILDAIATTIAAGGRVEIRNFGSFTARYRRARIGRNPVTGEVVQVVAKAVPYFKAGKGLLEGVTAASSIDYARNSKNWCASENREA